MKQNTRQQAPIKTKGHRRRLEDVLDIGLTVIGSAAVTLGSLPATGWQAAFLFIGIFFLVRVTRASIVRRMPPSIVHCTRCGTNLRVS